MPSGKRPATRAETAAKGGRARAAVLTPSERQAIARRAAQKRWGGYSEAPSPWESEAGDVTDGSEMPYSMFRGNLEIGDVELECHVLSDGQRVLTQREVVRVISGGRDSSNLVAYLRRNALYEEGFLEGRVLEFMVPGRPQPANGYDAEILIEICDLYLAARDRGLLKPGQGKLAKMAEIIVRACAKTGITALVDEVTGYQEIREKRALQLKLQAFIADDMQEWAKMFPDEFWFELARLEGTRYSPRSRPLRWGKYVMAFVYDAIDEDVGKWLRTNNPNPQHGKNHHQFLAKYGRDRVHDQLQQVIAVMKACDDMAEFREKFARVFKKSPLQLSFADLPG